MSKNSVSEDLGRVIIALMRRLGETELTLTKEEMNLEASLAVAEHNDTKETRLKVMSIEEGKELNRKYGHLPNFNTNEDLEKTTGDPEIDELLQAADMLFKLEKLKQKLEKKSDEPQRVTKTDKPN